MKTMTMPGFTAELTLTPKQITERTMRRARAAADGSRMADGDDEPRPARTTCTDLYELCQGGDDDACRAYADAC